MARDNETRKRMSTDQDLFGENKHKTHEDFANKHMKGFHEAVEHEAKRCAHLKDKMQKGIDKHKRRMDGYED